ncbi:MAG: phosphatase PAP2 family protein [Acidimicrobiales bacterium]
MSDELADRPPPWRIGTKRLPEAEWERELIEQFSAIDRAVYGSIAGVPTPSLDQALAALSTAANYSVLWFALAAAGLVSGRGSLRRAGVEGVVAIGLASTVVNQGAKRFAPRRRPDRTGMAVPEDRHVRMPSSTSFPSGHSASAFAFASAAGSASPVTSPPLHLLAALVAYSRVHTGVHYPGDVVVGSLIGMMAGQIVSGVTRTARRRVAARRG